MCRKWTLKNTPWLVLCRYLFHFIKMNIFLMNILDFKKMNICLNEYSGFLKKMSICFEWIFWIFIKWIIFWTNILVLVCLSQKWLSQDVSNSSEITDGSLVGPISVHFRGLLPILGPQEGFEAISWPHLGILNNFPHFLWMNNSIECSGLYWMNIFLMNIMDFVLNRILNWMRPNSMNKWFFSKRIAHP